MNPFEKTNGLIGILPTKVTAGLSKGYNKNIIINFKTYILISELKF